MSVMTMSIQAADLPKAPNIQEEYGILGIHAHLLHQFSENRISIRHITSAQPDNQLDQ